MRYVLVDTSVWVDHFRQRNDALINLLDLDLVMAHPLILGEIACGSPPNRIQTLSDLCSLRQSQQTSVREVVDFIERERLFGLGCGLVDMLLLTSALMTPEAELWTLDKRLSAMAERFDVMHCPFLH
jgi:predicted nucleic acid-binding protein